MQYISGGTLRGRRLFPPPAGIRPTMGYIRESIFDILMHRFQNRDWLLAGARVADVFAGTGAMGFEALSRGAAHVTFIDHALDAQSVIYSNSCILGVNERTTFIFKNALKLPIATESCTLVFLDAPYSCCSHIISDALSALQEAAWLAHGALCVIEHPIRRTFKLPTGFQWTDARTYGRTGVSFLLAISAAHRSLI